MNGSSNLYINSLFGNNSQQMNDTLVTNNPCNRIVVVSCIMLSLVALLVRD